MGSLHSPSKEGRKSVAFLLGGAEKVGLVVGMCVGKAIYFL